MRHIYALLLVATVGAGCTGSDAGDPPPPVKQMTQEEINAMPPQARAAMENAQRQGQANAQSRGINGGGN